MLRPHPFAKILGLAFVALLGVAMVLQFREGHRWVAMLQLLLGAVMLWGALPDLLLHGRDPPRALWRGPDGQLELISRSGRRRRVAVSPSTLLWSRGLLLVLEGEGGSPVRLLLGLGNVPAVQFAALRREWLYPRKGHFDPLT
jgi:hypothetical protein